MNMKEPRVSVTADSEPYEAIPHWLLLDKTLSANAVRLWLVLRKHRNLASKNSFPSRKRLAEHLGVSAATVDRAKQELLDIGAMCQRQRKTKEGDWTSNEYHIHWVQKTQCRHLGSQGGLLTSDDTYPAGDDTYPAGDETGLLTSDELTHTHIELTPNELKKADSSEPPTINQRANTITKVYADRQPMCKFPAIAGIVKKAMNAGHSDQAITDALLRLADEGRPVTVETLRIELEGLPPRRLAVAPAKESGTSMYLRLMQDIPEGKELDQ